MTDKLQSIRERWEAARLSTAEWPRAPQGTLLGEALNHAPDDIAYLLRLLDGIRDLADTIRPTYGGIAAQIDLRLSEPGAAGEGGVMHIHRWSIETDFCGSAWATCKCDDCPEARPNPNAPGYFFYAYRDIPWIESRLNDRKRAAEDGEGHS